MITARSCQQHYSPFAGLVNQGYDMHEHFVMTITDYQRILHITEETLMLFYVPPKVTVNNLYYLYRGNFKLESSKKKKKKKEKRIPCECDQKWYLYIGKFWRCHLQSNNSSSNSDRKDSLSAKMPNQLKLLDQTCEVAASTAVSLLHTPETWCLRCWGWCRCCSSRSGCGDQQSLPHWPTGLVAMDTMPVPGNAHTSH